MDVLTGPGARGQAWSRRRVRYAAGLLGALAVNLLLLAVVLGSRGRIPLREAPPTEVSLLAAPAAAPPGPSPAQTPPSRTAQAPAPIVAPAQTPSPPPPEPTPEPAPPVATPDPAASPSAEALEPIPLHPPAVEAGAPAAATGLAATPAAGAGCRILQDLQAKLEADGAAHTAIVQAPAQARSVANAMMLWDGRWPDDAALGSAMGREAIRSAVLSTVMVAPDACRTQLLHGPRMIVLGRSSNAAVVVFGSGDWRWNDLLSGR